MVTTKKENWMEPFAEHLGIIPPEFEHWRNLFAKHGSFLLLVEGETDKEYFEFLRLRYPLEFPLPEKVEVVSYNGKDALKNGALVKFALSKVQKYFITFDLDATREVQHRLESIGLVEQKDFAPIGISKPGRDAIEGLLPDRVLNAVNGRETDLVMQLSSGDNKQRGEARRHLKKRYLEEFKGSSSFTDSELANLTKLGRHIAKQFQAN